PPPSMPRIVSAGSREDRVKSNPETSRIHSPKGAPFEEESEPIIITHGSHHPAVVNLGSSISPPSHHKIPPVLHGLDRSKDQQILAGEIEVSQVTSMLLEKRRREEEERKEREREEATSRALPTVDFQVRE
ncbi:hypothetical protein PFISCL1PPCAC_21695, partial [Pristionchus fissidentatus]